MRIRYDPTAAPGGLQHNAAQELLQLFRDRQAAPEGPLLRFAVPFLAVAAATAAMHLLSPAAPAHLDLLLFFAAIAISAWYCGRGPGWLAVGLSALAVDYLFFWSSASRVWPQANHASWMIAFALCAALINIISLRRRNMEIMDRRHRDELQARVRIQALELQQRNEELATEIADRVQAETKLRDAQNELARASRAMTAAELTASISHEIKQPLSSVIANGEAALNWLKRSPPDLSKAKNSVTAGVESAGRVSEIVDSMRLLMAGARPFHVIDDLNELVDEVLLIAAPDFREHGITVIRNLHPRLRPVMGDPIQLRQLILNLVNNAIDALSIVEDRTREISISTELSGFGNVRFSVADTGSGFVETDVSGVFKPFYSTKQDGMGIGLTICKTIAQIHGGFIDARPNVPHGAVFQVEFPARKPHD